MLSYDEVKNFGKKAGKKQSDREKLLKGSEPAKEAMYKKWQETKVAGGTVNPIISTDAKVKENRDFGERKTTTYEETLAKNRRTAGKYNAAVPASAKATKNIKELIFGAAKQGGTVNPTISAADFSTRFDKMTDRENAIYSHYKRAGKNKKAAEYLKAIETDVNQRAAAQRTADAKRLAEDSTMGGLYARYMGALTTPLATAYSLAQEARGEAIDPNSPLFMGEQIRQGQTDGFLGESKGPKRWMKEAALGAFDWGSQVATLGALGLGGSALGAASSGLYGASAFSGNAKDATERGATTEEAVAYGTIGAAAEIITEKLGFERLFELGKLAKVAGGKGRLAMEILKNMGSEGLEEGTSEAANQIADALIMGDRSQMAETYRMARGAGQTEGQATATALRGAAAQIGYSTGIGALSGGMIAGGIAGGSRLAGRNMLGEETQRIPMEQERAMEQEKPMTEQNMPSVEQTTPVTEQNMLSAEQTTPITEQTAPVIEQTAPTAEEQPTAEVREMGQQTAERTVSPETQEAESYTKDLQEYSGKYYGAKGQEVYLRKAAETGNLDHTAAFNTYYRAGIAGITEDEIQPTAYTAAADKLMLNEAWMAGAEDRRAEIANAIRGTSKLTGKRGLIVGEDVKATEEQLALASLYADIGGARIRLVDEISFEQGGKKHTANGYYEDGMITLALKSDSFMGTMNHEMIHYIRKANPAGYDAMRELVFKIANKDGTDIEKHWANYEELCRDIYGEDVAAADVMEEMVADGFQKILNNTADLKEFLTELHRKDRTLFDRIKEFLEKAGKTIKALFEDNTYTEFAEDLSRDLENIKQLRKKFAEVLADTGRMEEGAVEKTGKGKYAIKYSEENKPFVAIEEDILDGVPRKEWTKKVKETLKKKYPNGIQIRNEYIHVNGRQTASEMTNSKYAKWLRVNSPAEYADKLRFANNADEILYAAQNWRGEGLHHPRKDSIVEFARADALIRIGERGYSADVVVGTKGNSEMVLYDILYLKSASINEKKQEQTAVHSQKEIPTESAAPVSKNSVAQKAAENNNRNVTKFSLRKAVEEKKDLIAVHNIKAQDMDRALQIGGFPMPSIAIVKDDAGHSKYGEISAVFGKETIDPAADKRNAVYGGDAWTPTVPRVDYEVNYKKKNAIEDEIETLARGVANGIFARASVLSSMGIDEETSLSKRELAEKLAGDDAVRAAYLAAQGKDIKPEYKEKVYDKYGNEFLQKITDRYGEQKLEEMTKKLERGEELDEESISEVKDIWKQDQIKKMEKQFRKKTPEEIAKRAELRAEKTVGSYEAGSFIRHAWEMYQDDGGLSEEIDRFATSDKLREEANYKEVADWVEGKLTGLLGEAGVYNGKEPYTPSGSRRSFKELHYAYTLENLVKAMSQTQEERGEGLWGASGEGLVSVATPKYKSIEEIRKDKGRLQKMSDEEYRENLKGLDGTIAEIIQKVKDGNEAHSDNPFTEENIIETVLLEAAWKKGKPTAQSVKKHFAAEGYKITDSLAKGIVGLYGEAATIPTGYFEAKPKRAVGMEEIRALIIPDSIEAEMKDRLKEQGIPLLEYADGDEADRLRVLNSVEDVKFSIRKKDVDTKTAENENWKAAYEGLLREFEITKEPLRDREAAQKVVRKFLKEIKSGYDEEQFLDRFVSLCNYGADLKSDSDYKDLVTACAMLAEDALRESAEMDMELYNEYADLRKELRTSTLYVNKKTLNDLAAQDIRYNELRQANFGRVKLSQKDGESIDTKYAEWAERFPELFKADQNTSQSELLMDIIAVRQSLDPVVKNPYFEEIEEHAEACAYELLGMMNDVALEKPTFADKYEEKLRKLRQENKEALRRAKEQAKNEKKLLRERYATNAEARIAAVKEKYEKRMDRSEYWRLRRLAVKDAKALAEWMKSPTDSKHIPKKFKETVGTILGLIETEKPDLRIPLQSFVAMKGALQELYGDQEGLYLYVEQDDQVINILDRFIQKYPEGANLDTMNGTDMKYFRNLMASVKKACTDANKLHTSQREKSVIEVSEGFIKKSKKKKDARETGIIRRMQDFLGLEMLDANSFFKRIGGDVYSELWKGLRKGLDKKINHWREAMDFINELVDPKTMRKWTEEAAKEFEIGGTKVQMTIPQIMSLYCLMKRDQGRQHIIGTQIPTENGILDIRGGGFKAEPISHTQKGKKAKIEKAKVVEPTAADIQAILGTLTEEQKKAAEAIQKYLSEDVAAWGNETTMLLFGYEKFTTKNYFPIVSDKNFVNQLVTKTDDIAPSLKSLGMTKNINRFANNPVMIQDIFKVFANHVDQMSNYNAFAASESDFNKFMNYKIKQEKGKEKGKVDTVRKEMDRTMGKGGEKYIKTLMNRLVTAAGLSDDSDFAKMLVRNMKVASVGANLRVIIQQPTAYLRAGNSLSMKYLLNPAVFKKTDKETIYKYAPIALWKSWGNYEMDTGKTMYEQMIAPTKAAKTKELLMAGAGWADEVTWSRLWNACVLEAKDKHKGATQEEIYTIAGERFGEIVDESQVVDSVLHRSQIMRKKGLYTQMTTSFMSEPTKTFNMASNALVELVRNNTPENRRKFIRCYMTIIASSVATACAAGLADAMRDDDDDDTFFEKWKKAVAGDYSKAETPKDYIMAVLSNNIADNLNPMGMIPYLRDGWSLLQGYDINRTDFDWLNDIMKNIKRWEQFAAGESEYTLASLLLNTTGAISKMTGVPIGSAERDLKALTNWVVLHIIGDDEMKFNYKKLSKDVGSEKNASYYAERMLKAKFSGNDDLATRIYNEMITAGVSNEKIDNKLESKEKKLLKEEPETTEGAEAYAAGDYNGYMNAIDSLTAKGYGKGYAVKVIESVYKKMKGGDDEEETFEPITNDYWDNEPDKDPAGYEMMFNAYMSGNTNDYSRMWDRMEANGKEEGNIKSSMKSRLKKAYQAAKAEGDYQKAQRAKTEFLRLGGKPETLEG